MHAEKINRSNIKVYQYVGLNKLGDRKTNLPDMQLQLAQNEAADLKHQICHLQSSC